MSCDGNCPKCLSVDQPPDDREWRTPDGVFVKEMFLAKAGTMVPQHAHEYAHTSLLFAGSVRVWADGEIIGDFHAKAPIEIARGVKHSFMSLEDSTIILCIHNLRGMQNVAVRDEHQFLSEVA